MSRIGPKNPSCVCAILALFGLLVLGSGCLGPEDTDPVPGDDPADEDPEHEAQEDPEPHDDEATTIWSSDVKEDRYSGSSAGVSIANATHTFTVKDNVTTLFLNLTTDDAELNLGIIDPECPDNTICEEEPTQDGSLSHRVDEPVAGDWELWVRGDELFHYEQAYRLEVTRGSEPD